MPPWAHGARIVFDAEHSLAFVRHDRRGPWMPYTVRGTTFRLVDGGGRHTKLDRARQAVLEDVAASIEAFAKALHPGARYHHLNIHSSHACGISYMDYPTAYRVEEVTCPL